jgi:hypothetical protein
LATVDVLLWCIEKILDATRNASTQKRREKSGDDVQRLFDEKSVFPTEGTTAMYKRQPKRMIARTVKERLTGELENRWNCF